MLLIGSLKEYIRIWALKDLAKALEQRSAPANQSEEIRRPIT